MKNYDDNIDDQLFPHFMRNYDDNVNDAKLSRELLQFLMAGKAKTEKVLRGH